MSAFKLSAQAHEAILDTPLVDDKAVTLAINERAPAPVHKPAPVNTPAPR